MLSNDVIPEHMTVLRVTGSRLFAYAMTVQGQVIIITNYDLYAKLSEHREERKWNKSFKYGCEIDQNRSYLLNLRYKKYYGLWVITMYAQLE